MADKLVNDQQFEDACIRATEALRDRPGFQLPVKPTKRQYSKWRRGYGSAYDYGRNQEQVA